MPSALDGLDLSFAQVEGKKKSSKESGELDLGFLEAKPVQREFNPTDNQDDKQTIAIDEERERGFFASVMDFFTGGSKQTKETEELPEFGWEAPTLLFKRPGDMIKMSIGMLFSLDPEDQAKIIKRNFPEVTFERDDKGNIIVDASALGGGRGILNQPGTSPQDLVHAGGLISAFTPAGRAARNTLGITANAARVGAASGATQTAMDVASQASGRDENVSLKNLRVGDVATATIGGAAAQALVQSLAKGFSAFRAKYNKTGVDEEIRNYVKSHADEIGINVDDLSDDVIDDVMKSVDDATSIDEALRVQGEKEFGVGLTKGERTLNQKQLSFEDRARSGTLGEKPQNILSSFDEQRNVKIQEARSKVETALAGKNDLLENVPQAGGVIKQGIQKSEEQAKKVVDKAFDKVSDAALKPGSFQKMTKSMREAIDGLEFVKLPELAPATSGLLKTLDDLDKTIGVSKSKALRPVHVRKIEEVRRAINSFIQSADKAPDRRNVTIMQKAFDDFLDNAVKKSLFSGDTKAMESLKSARGIFREYAKKFRESPTRTKSGRLIPDQEGKFIEKIIADNPTDKEVINALFGASNFSKSSGAKMASRFKNILGGNSPEWGTVKQAAFVRLVKTNLVNGKSVISGQQTQKAIEKAFSENPELMKEIFSNTEIALIRRFSAHVKRTQPDIFRSRENPSGTAQVLTKSVGDLIKRITNFTGDPTIIATSKGIEISRGITSKSKASSAVRPFEKTIKANPDIVGETTGGLQAVVQGEN